MKRNIVAKVLSCVLALSMVLGVAACGNTDNKESKESSSQPKESSKVQESSSQAEEEREEVELVWYTYGNERVGKEATLEAVNEYLKEKLNTTVDWHMLAAADYDQVTSTAFSAGTYMDVLISGAARVNFNVYAAQNAFLPLNDYIDEYLPGTKALLPEAAWDAYTVNGNIYAVPPSKDLANRWCLLANQDLMDDLGLTFPESYETGDEIVDFFYDAKEARDKKYPEKKDQPIAKTDWYLENFYYFEPFIGSFGNTIIGANIPTLKGFEGYSEDGKTVFSPFLTEEFREVSKTIRKMVEDNIIPLDVATYDPDKVMNKAGEFIGYIGLGTIYADPHRDSPDWTTTLYPAKYATQTTGGMQNGGFALSAECKYPERALEVIELINTDEYLATVLRFGPEGEGWTDADNDGVVEMTEKNSDPANRYWYEWYGWYLGGLLSTKSAPGMPPKFGEIIQQFNASGVGGANTGFIMDQTPVANEIAACNNVVAEYANPLRKGQIEDVDKAVDEFIQKLKDNGIEKIIAECQSQLDAWTKAN